MNYNQNVIYYQCKCGPNDIPGYCVICKENRKKRVNEDALKEISNMLSLKHDFALPSEIEDLANYYYQFSLRGFLQTLQISADKKTIDILDEYIIQLEKKIKNKNRLKSYVEIQLDKNILLNQLNALNVLSGNLIEIKKLQLIAIIRALDANANLKNIGID